MSTQPPANGRPRPAHPTGTAHTQPAGADPLAELIAAAAAPAAGPLPGEAHAMAGFQAARHEPATQPGRKSMIQLALAKLLTIKAAAVIAGLTLTGGIAVAAGTGAIPNPLFGNQPAAPAPAHSTTAPAQPTSGSPASAAMYGLCTAYLAANDTSILDTPPYQPLITAAGGKENVTTYCTKVTASPPAASPDKTTPPVPTPGGPGPNPAATPTPSHPTGTPTPSHPTGATPTPNRPR